MKNIKRTYILFAILLVVLALGLCVSFAFLTNEIEQKGKLNIVAGTLDYKIESEDLINNEITVEAGQTKEILIKLTSLNSIDSKYELYYTLNNENEDVEVGYSSTTSDSISGTIDANGVKKITVIIRNNSDTNTTVTFNAIGGLEKYELVLNQGNSLNQVVGIYTAYSIGDEITLTDGSKWHVLEASDETKENVVLLSDYNLNSDGTYNSTCQGAVGDNDSFVCSPMAFDTDNTNTYDESDTNNVGYFIQNTYTPLVLAEFPEAINITLPTAEQIAQADSKIFNQVAIKLSNSWMLTTLYWTKTALISDTNIVWRVNGRVAYIGNDDSNASNSISYGVRPTITIPKKYIVNTISSAESLVIGTSVEAIDGSKWHVLETSGSDSKYVTLLSDYNLNSDGSYNTTCGSDIDGTYACSTMAFDPDNTNTYDENDSNNIGYFMKNTFQPLVIESLLGTTDVTLPTAEQIAYADGQVFQQATLYLTTSWLLTTDYWTKTARSSYTQYPWSIYASYVTLHDVSYLYYSTQASVSNSRGARPVITTLKTNLLDK